MISKSKLKPSARVLAETPRKPSDEEEEKLHEKLLVAAETFLLNGDITKLSLDHLAILADASIEEVSQFFTNPESVATALTERYVELAGRETIGDGVPEFEVALATAQAGTRKAAELLSAHYDDHDMSPNTHFLQIMASGEEIIKTHHRASTRIMRRTIRTKAMR